MADIHTVTFYPVGNGDTTHIVLANGRRILFDFCHRKKGEDDKEPDIDLKKQLKEELDEAKTDFFDVVAFTHADLDHIQGSTEFFELEHAAKYQGDDRIKIQELWVPAAMLLEDGTNEQQSDEFIILRQEARHRLLEGKGILVFSKPEALTSWLEPELEKRKLPKDARDHLFVDAGSLVDGFSLADDKVEFFCHSPFIEHCDTGDIIRNEASLVFNVRFEVDGAYYDYLEVGDATWESLEGIVNATKAHKNEDRLEWNLFNLPHHCSAYALSDDKGEKETTPKPLVQELLRKGKQDAYVVSCSKPIPDSKDAYIQDLPPHIQARKAYERYLDEVDGREFLVTMEEPNANKPQPLVFEIGTGGVTWKKAAASGAAAMASFTPPRAG